MAAGSISAPQIIAIIQPTNHRAGNICTNTPVTIQSDSVGVSLFFTLDGSKPTPPPVRTGSETRRFTGPVLLPGGRVVVRAVAVGRDGQQSSVVSKVFSVDLMEDRRPSWYQETNVEGEPGMPALLPPPSAGEGRPPPLSPSDGLMGHGVLVTHQAPPSADTPTSCLQHQVNHDTSPGPQAQRLPPAGRGQTVSCVFCKSEMPINTSTCLICETSIEPQLQVQQHVLCVCCGSGNPVNVSSCVTCETRLQPAALTHGVPSVRPLDCVTCDGVNADAAARFCSCCGSKLVGDVTRSGRCGRCAAKGRPDAFNCYLKTPPTTSDDITDPVASQPRLSAHTSHDVTRSDSAPQVNIAPPTVDRSTQTGGLHYPSATGKLREQQRAPLSAVSPGRGYWRRQVDHVCAHLRSFTQNNASFRTLLGEPRLGRLVSAVLRDDTYEVSLTVSFTSVQKQEVGLEDGMEPVGGASGKRGGPLGRTVSLSSVSERSQHRRLV